MKLRPLLVALASFFLLCSTPNAMAQSANILPYGSFQSPLQKHHTRVSHGTLRTVKGEVRYLPHPAGCPRSLFCGCGAAVNIFGRPIRSLWLARAWFKFPRSAPGHNKVAVRRGHVFVLKQHVEGSRWYVYDANSGGRRTRYHIRSIAGYTIVDPLSS